MSYLLSEVKIMLDKLSKEELEIIDSEYEIEQHENKEANIFEFIYKKLGTPKNTHNDR